MNIKTVKISTLKFWDRNPRESVDEERLQEILKKRGQLMPLLVDGRDNSTVLGGNMRLKAMKSLGWEECAVSIVTPTDDKDAIEIALNDNDHFGKYIEKDLIKLVTEFKIDTRINISTAPMKINAIMPTETDYSEKNKEVNPNSLGQKFKVVLNYNEEEYERALSLLSVMQEKLELQNNEQVILTLLENAS